LYRFRSVGTNLKLLNLACPERGNPNSPIRHIEVRYGFPPAGDVWEVEDIESTAQAKPGEGRALIKVAYDDPPESVADASTSARRPMVDDSAPDPTPEDFGL
jgi:hypothetical protein